MMGYCLQNNTVGRLNTGWTQRACRVIFQVTTGLFGNFII